MAGMIRSALALAALLAAGPALAETVQSDWKEARIAPLSEHVFNVAGVRVSNCHIEFVELGSVTAVPKCYALNASEKVADVRVEFVVLNAKGDTILSTTLARSDLLDMNGQELLQTIPVDRDAVSGPKTGRVRVWAATRR